MTTKKKLSNQITPELQSFIDKIAAKYQPNAEVLQRRIDNAEARYNRYQQFSDIPARLVSTLQKLILEGWRFCPVLTLQFLPTQRWFPLLCKSPPN